MPDGRECASVALARLHGGQDRSSRSSSSYRGGAWRRCVWPAERCPYTPDWQLFSACLHPHDAAMAMLWHGLRGPFSVPCGIPGHACQWEALDHHMVGCTVCGRVHRCDVDQCAVDAMPWEGALYSSAQEQCSAGIRCPAQHTEDGSIVCSITGVCIRTSSYGLEYELLSRQGLSSEGITGAMAGGHHHHHHCQSNQHPDHDGAVDEQVRARHDDGQRGLQVCIQGEGCAAGTCGTPPLASPPHRGQARRTVPNGRGKRQGSKGRSGPFSPSLSSALSSSSSAGKMARGMPFHVQVDAMRNEFHKDRLAECLGRLLRAVLQDRGVLYARFVDACVRRDRVLARVLACRGGARGQAVCLLSVAASLEAAVREGSLQGDSSRASVQCLQDPFQYLRVWPDREVERVVQRVHPHVYRLLAVLKTLDANKYKGNNVPWMLLGMLYLCTTGLNIGHVRVLPIVPELRTILPHDNRIHHYFGGMGINTKCVTDMSNMIVGTLKGQHRALAALQNV